HAGCRSARGANLDVEGQPLERSILLGGFCPGRWGALTHRPEGETSARRKRWQLTQEAFDALLLALDRDRRAASERYERLHRLLVDFFSWEGATSPEDLADETLNRLAKRISSGVNIEDINRYTYGVAKLVFRESLHEKERWNAAVRELSPAE